MDEKINEESLKFKKKRGIIFFLIFSFLILAGIYVKRMMGHPEFMMLFHGPAAVFLVMAGMDMTFEQRKRYKLLKVKA
jgi:hypothetical protein